MITRRIFALALLSTLCLINGDWGTKETSQEKGRWQSQPVNIAGKLITISGDSYTVDNISLNRQIKQIKLFALPGAALFKISTEKSSVRMITKEPVKYLDTTNIDLVEIKKLETPFPDITWTYQEEPNKGRKLEFIQVDITLADGTKNSYLAPSNTMLYCDRETHAAGPQEKDVPLAAIKELTITGYTRREESKETYSKTSTPAACPVCPVCAPATTPAA